MNKVNVAVLLMVVAASWFATAGTLHFVGDSTLAQRMPDHEVGSWGQFLEGRLAEGWQANLAAQSGTSAKSFRELGFWQKRVMSKLAAGDWVIIQFGINEAYHTNAEGLKRGEIDRISTVEEFRRYVTGFVKEVRERDAKVVLCTPIDDRVNSAKRPLYAAETRRMAKELGVDLVDMMALTSNQVHAADAELSRRWYICWYGKKDNCHPTKEGARVFAMEFLKNVRARKLGIAALFAEGPHETMPISRMDSLSKDPAREPGAFGDYWWANRFARKLGEIEALKRGKADMVLVGDSIMHFWQWRHPSSWAKFTKGRKVLNLGYAGDKTEHVIWRLENGELDGYVADKVVVMIGTNNNTSDSSKPENVAAGIRRIVRVIRSRQPKAKIILHPIFPRGCPIAAKRGAHAAARERNEATNKLIKEFAEREGNVQWVDFNAKLVDESGWVPLTLMADQIHPSDRGYDLWMDALAK